MESKLKMIEWNKKVDALKKLTAKHSLEAKALFDILPARDWHDCGHPKSGFLKKLLKDHNTRQAIGICQSEMRNW